MAGRSNVLLYELPIKDAIKIQLYSQMGVKHEDWVLFNRYSHYLKNNGWEFSFEVSLCFQLFYNLLKTVVSLPAAEC